MSYANFSDCYRKVLALANQEAQRFSHEYIGTEHLLLAVVKEGTGLGAQALKAMDIDLRKVRLEVEKLIKSGPEMVTMGKLPQTPRAKKVIEYALEEARNLQSACVKSEHLLLGLLRENDGIAAIILLGLGVKLSVLRMIISNLSKADCGNNELPIECNDEHDHLNYTVDSPGKNSTSSLSEGSLWDVRYSLVFSGRSVEQQKYIYLNAESNYLNKDVLDCLGFMCWLPHQFNKDCKFKLVSATYLGAVYS